MATLTSFFLSESGFASPPKALSGSWIAGIIVGTFSLLTPVIAAFASGTNCVTSTGWCGWSYNVQCCCTDGDPVLECGWIGHSCSCS